MNPFPFVRPAAVRPPARRLAMFAAVVGLPPSVAVWFEEWFQGAFLNGFCVSLARPGLLTLLFLVLCLRFGAGLGLPLLFWRARPVRPGPSPAPGKTSAVVIRTRPDMPAQFSIGVGLGFFVGQVVLSGYLFEEFATNYTADRPPFCEVRPPDGPVEAPAFGGETHGYPGRFRYDPVRPESLGLYAAAVGSSFLAIGLAALALRVVWGAAAWGYQRATGWKPYVPRLPDRPPLWRRGLNRVGQFLWGRAAIPDEGDRNPIPYSPALPLGLLVGLALVAFSAGEWAGKPAVLSSKPTGERLVRMGGWGQADARRAALEKRIGAELAPASSADASPAVVAVAAAAGAAAQSAADHDALWQESKWLQPYAAIFGAFFWNFAGLAAVSVVLMALPRDWKAFSPAVGVLFLLNLVLFLQVHLNYFFSLPAEFMVACLFAWMLLMGRAYKMRFPNLAAYYKSPVPLDKFYTDRAAAEAATTAAAGAAVPPPPPSPAGGYELIDSAAVTFGAGKSAGRLPPLVIVCASGGGSRAAAWTMKVLLEIEEAFGNPAKFYADANLAAPAGKPLAPTAFPYHVRLVTGASGGMVAAAQYVASLAKPTPGAPAVNRRAGLTGRELFDGVCQDFLNPIVHTMVSRDFPALFLPARPFGDRGRVLEEAWDRDLKGQLHKRFAALRAGERAGWRPSLIFSPMLVEDGRQLFISNLDLHRVVRNHAVLLGEPAPPAPAPDLNPADAAGRRLLSREGLEFFKVFPAAKDFRVGTAARMSASFPYVLPAVALPTNPPRRVVDAGYYDNYGVSIAASWLFTHLDWVQAHTSGVVVVQIRDGASGAARRREAVPDAFPSTPAAALHWLTSPPAGLWAFRMAAHAFRNDNLLHLLDTTFRARLAGTGVRPDFFTTVTFELQQGDDVALNFTLTEGERGTIETAAESPGFRQQLRSLLEWW